MRSVTPVIGIFRCYDHAFVTVVTLKKHKKSEGAAHTPETSMAKNPLLCTRIFKEELHIHGTLH